MEIFGYLIVAGASLLTGLALRRKTVTLEISNPKSRTRIEAHSIDEIDELIDLAGRQDLGA